MVVASLLAALRVSGQKLQGRAGLEEDKREFARSADALAFYGLGTAAGAYFSSEHTPQGTRCLRHSESAAGSLRAGGWYTR